VGTTLNRQRALNLLAQAATVCGLPTLAVRYGREGLALSEANRDLETPFDRAATLAALSAALRGSPAQSEADALAEQALSLAAQLPVQDRPVIARMLAQAVAFSGPSVQN
jgi:hypothetical protein